MKKSDEIRQKIAALTDEAQALHNVAEKENRDLTDEESTRWNAIMAADTGELAKSETELASAVAHEQEVSRLRTMRMAQIQPQADDFLPSTPRANAQPQVFHRLAKLNAFKGDEAAADAYAVAMWLRSLKGHLSGNRDEKAEKWIQAKRGWDIRATATEGTPSEGGYTVPTPLSNAIIDVRELAGVSRKVADIEPMTSNTLDVPKLVSGATVYYPGEAGAITASDAVWGSVGLTAKKRACLSYVSQELQDDSAIAIVDKLASYFGTNLGVQEDNEFINGDGTGTYGGEVGLLSAIHASAVAQATATSEDTWAELTIANHTAAMGKLNSKYWPWGTAWICSAQYYYQVMVRLMLAGGGNGVAQIEQGPGGQPMFLGSPVFFTGQMPTSTATATVCALFGAFNQAVKIGTRSVIRIAYSDQFKFDEDRTAIRATTRYDINVHESNADGPYTAVKTGS